jgi:hypothetical protein
MNDVNEKMSKPESIARSMPGLAVLFGKELFTKYLLPTYFGLANHTEYII